MAGGHGHHVHVHADSAVHRVQAHAKIVTLVVFMLIVVATPREWYAVFAWYALALAGLVAVTRVPPRYFLTRLFVETPFVVFALLMPFFASGPRVEVLGVGLSVSGLMSAWALMAKGTLGVLAGVLLAATTEPRQLLRGLERLRLPAQLVQILSFMIRYMDVIMEEARRMATARASRGFTASNPRQWAVLAVSVGALFIRSYERGERVHHAMLARGYAGGRPS